jgi:hypothetical protein
MEDDGRTIRRARAPARAKETAADGGKWRARKTPPIGEGSPEPWPPPSPSAPFVLTMEPPAAALSPTANDLLPDNRTDLSSSLPVWRLGLRAGSDR